MVGGGTPAGATGPETTGGGGPGTPPTAITVTPSDSLGASAVVTVSGAAYSPSPSTPVFVSLFECFRDTAAKVHCTGALGQAPANPNGAFAGVNIQVGRTFTATDGVAHTCGSSTTDCFVTGADGPGRVASHHLSFARVATTTTVASSANPSVAGQPVAFTATVTSPSGVPTGTVQFKDGTTPLGARALVAGKASFTDPSLAIGNHSITATYSRDGAYNPSTSAPLAQVVTAPALDAGGADTCGVDAGNHLTCWGGSFPGALPAGTFVTVSVNLFNACAIRTDATLVCWGNNSTGQNSAPTGSFVAVSTGNGHSCAIRSDATLACWGFNADGRATPPSGTFMAVSAGENHSCAVRTNATVACWGKNTSGEATPPPGSFSAVSAGNSFTCGVHLSGTLACWGTNASGQSAPPTGSFVSVSAGDKFACAIRGDGTLACWGDDTYGQSAPPPGTFVALTAGSVHACATRTDGTPACWGYNNHGQLAAAPAFTSPLPPRAVAGTAYAHTFTAGGVPSPIYSLTGGSLPPGLALSAGGVLSGTPTAPGTYSGITVTADNRFFPPASQTFGLVVAGPSSVAVTSSRNPSNKGQSVTFTATVSTYAGGPTPTGTVQFKDGARNLGTSRSLTGGKATLSTAGLGAGSHSITAVYSGDTSLTPSTSAALVQSVIGIATTTVVTSSANPSAVGQTVTFTAVVTPASGTALPTGTVQFKDGATNLGPPQSFTAGSASLSTSSLSPGPHAITAVYSGDANFNAGTSAVLVQIVRPPVVDFDGDHRTDVSVFRPATATWFVHRSSGTDTAVAYGATGDVPVPGDYDGDGRTDIAIFRPSTGLWSIHRSSDGADVALTYGVNGDVAVPADYDGDGRTDVAVFRPAFGGWYYRQSADGADVAVTFGVPGDVPVVGDYDGDGRTDIAVFRPGAATWFVHGSSGTDTAVAFGAGGDVPAPGDYDGDGRTDVAVFRPSSASWSVAYSSGGTATLAYGSSGSVPVPGDYDGDGRTDIGVFDPATGVWSYRQSSNGADVTVSFGTAGDVPLPLPPAIRTRYFA